MPSDLWRAADGAWLHGRVVLGAWPPADLEDRA